MHAFLLVITFPLAAELSNGYSPANLANSSTRQNGRLQKYARLARLADIRQAVLRGLAEICQVVLRGLARLADIRQAVLRGLARLAKGKFGKCYANLASLANLASVG